MSRERKGIMIALIGTLVATPDAVLIRWAQKENAELTAIIVWELVVTAVIMLVYSRRYEFWSWEAIRRNPLIVCGLAVTAAAVSILLSYAYVFTVAAAAVMLFHLHPLWSSVLGWLCLGDTLALRTVLALVLAIVALIIMFLPEITMGSFGSGGIGDAMALATSFSLSMYLCLARYASRVDPDLSTTLVSALGLLVAAVAMVPIAFATGSTVLLPPLSIPATILDGLVVGAINVANAIAPKYATATQIGLIELIEAVISPVWVYAIYHEVPDIFTIAGGCGVILILIGHELLDPDCLGSPSLHHHLDKLSDCRLDKPLLLLDDDDNNIPATPPSVGLEES